MNEKLPADTNDSQRKIELANYWKANSRLILILMSVWALVSIVASILFIDSLNQYQIGKLPAGFWMAQQGAIYIFVILIFIYAFAMDRLDKKYHVDE